LALKKRCVLCSCRVEKKSKRPDSRYAKKPRLVEKAAIAGTIAV
jgi:hypothetical protein